MNSKKSLWDRPAPQWLLSCVGGFLIVLADVAGPRFDAGELLNFAILGAVGSVMFVYGAFGGLRAGIRLWRERQLQLLIRND
jgi:hypothetical protein